MSKMLKIVFTISIILNVLFFGLLIGHFSHRISMHPLFKGNIIETIQNLPPNKRELVFKTIKDLKTETQSTKDEIEDNRNQILETLTAPEFDTERFEKQVKDLHLNFEELTTELSKAIIRLAQNLNQEERKALAEIIVRQHHSHRSKETNWNQYWEDKPE